MSLSSESLVERESTLAERSGTSAFLGFGLVPSGAGLPPWGSESQQNVSRFHTLQLKFSSRFPSSNDSAHLENTGEDEL